MSTQAPTPVIAARTDFVMGQFCQTLTNAFVAANQNGGEVFYGWPNPDDIKKNVTGAKFLVSVYPSMVRRVPDRAKLTPRKLTPAVPLIVSNVLGKIEFGGSVVAALNVAIVLRQAPWAIVYTTNANDTFETIAAGLAQKFTAANIPNALATATGPVLSITGLTPFVNVGGTGALIAEVDRIERRVQVNVWSAQSQVRGSVADAIRAAVGTTRSQFFDLGDGTSARARFFAETIVDESESDLSLFEDHLIYLVEYGILSSTPATQVVAFVPSFNIGS